jgi:hypothetical protein
VFLFWRGKRKVKEEEVSFKMPQATRQFGRFEMCARRARVLLLRNTVIRSCVDTWGRSEDPVAPTPLTAFTLETTKIFPNFI